MVAGDIRHGDEPAEIEELVSPAGLRVIGNLVGRALKVVRNQADLGGMGVDPTVGHNFSVNRSRAVAGGWGVVGVIAVETHVTFLGNPFGGAGVGGAGGITD